MLTCVITALVNAHKFKDAGNEAATGIGITGLQKPRVSNRLTKQKSSLSVTWTMSAILGRLRGNPRVRSETMFLSEEYRVMGPFEERPSV